MSSTKNPKTPQKSASAAKKNKEENGPSERSNSKQSPNKSAAKTSNGPPVSRIVTGMFKNIATEESEVSIYLFILEN